MFELADQLDKLRAGYPAMSAFTLVTVGVGIGWAIAWLILNQRLKHHAERIEELLGRLGEKLPVVERPRDREYDQHIKGVITGYHDDLRKALRTLLTTRNPNILTSQEYEQFHSDSLLDSVSIKRGDVKAELRDIVGRILDELGT